MNNENDSKTLRQIDAYVREFAETHDDTTLLCVMRLMAVVYDLQADQMHRIIESEEEKNK
jgi:hypothetical protein